MYIDLLHLLFYKYSTMFLSAVETDVLLPQVLRGNIGAHLKSEVSLHITECGI